MRGVNAKNGKAISGIEHLKQSIVDILTTPIGSRVMRRDYGSSLFSLVDAPSNRQTIGEIYSATIESLLRWEPRFFPQTIKVVSVAEGKIQIALTGYYVPDGSLITLDGIAIS
jgi:uncharacterized protein